MQSAELLATATPTHAEGETYAEKQRQQTGLI
jgi:hypothetical protein